MIFTPSRFENQVEKFQVAQLKSIAEDYNRHKDILAKRKDEIVALRKEVEREESGRDAYLKGFEKKLEKHLWDRQLLLRGGGGPSVNISNDNPLLDELNNPDHLELTSVDEYAPYGLAPHSRLNGPGPSKSTGSRGRGRGRRRGGGSAATTTTR